MLYSCLSPLIYFFPIIFFDTSFSLSSVWIALSLASRSLLRNSLRFADPSQAQERLRLTGLPNPDQTSRWIWQSNGEQFGGRRWACFKFSQKLAPLITTPLPPFGKGDYFLKHADSLLFVTFLCVIIVAQRSGLIYFGGIKIAIACITVNYTKYYNKVNPKIRMPIFATASVGNRWYPNNMMKQF
jgi:hypothetical protein